MRTARNQNRSLTIPLGAQGSTFLVKACSNSQIEFEITGHVSVLRSRAALDQALGILITLRTNPGNGLQGFVYKPGKTLETIDGAFG